MSIWTDTSSAALQAQLQNTLFVVHLFAGCVFLHVLGTLRRVEWLIGRGRIACRWSLFNAAGSRFLPLVSIASSIAWLDYQEFDQGSRPALFVLAQTTQIVSQIFSLMIITLGVASIWNNRQITYLVETAFLGIAGVSFASLASKTSDGVAPLSHTLFALVLARMIFCGFLLILAFWGILNSRRQESKLSPLQPMTSQMMSLYNAMHKDMFPCYCVAFLAQLPAVVAFALSIDPSGLLRFLTEFVSFASITVIGSLVFRHLATSSKRCPVTQYCIVVGLIMHLTDWGQIVHRHISPVHAAGEQAEQARNVGTTRCPYLTGRIQRPTEEKSRTALTVVAEAGMINFNTKRQSSMSGSTSTTLMFATSSSNNHGVPCMSHM